ncbi:uncharacterized protein VICG_00658 [Vittaforma corneae ATCC 50505]|uniref:FAR-17a/AIG1-like protein n=1 Tax=Vittaforma corneae (strain ATCC 50505) TaxID=993615 RepID=L2GNR4_VITCO|nr:uncharacterized protein VICG_00658 [Vittaforma corneae ATCC 50505]ELA42259.1 hypothetical protein VICG_00658 [Vittaforma corneae ATCC 50505]
MPIAQILICVLGMSMCLYSLSPWAFPVELHNYFTSKYLGYGSFLTFWNIYFTLITFASKLGYLMIKKLIGIGAFTYFLHITFSFLFPLSLILSIIVFLGYWPLMLINYNNFYPVFLTEKNIRNPMFTDLCLHLFPLLSLSLLRTTARLSCSLINIFFIFIIGLAYVISANYVFYIEGAWPYPFMDTFGWIEANVLFAGGIILSIGILLILRKVQPSRPRK